jgi:hypothetical protein
VIVEVLPAVVTVVKTVSVSTGSVDTTVTVVIVAAK